MLSSRTYSVDQKKHECFRAGVIMVLLKEESYYSGVWCSPARQPRQRRAGGGCQSLPNEE